MIARMGRGWAVFQPEEDDPPVGRFPVGRFPVGREETVLHYTVA